MSLRMLASPWCACLRQPARRRAPVHRDAVGGDLVDARVDRRIGRQQRAEVDIVEHQQVAIAERGDIGAPLAPAEQRELAEEVAAPELDALAVDADLDRARGDEVHRACRARRAGSAARPGIAKRGLSSAAILSSWAGLEARRTARTRRPARGSRGRDRDAAVGSAAAWRLSTSRRRSLYSSGPISPSSRRL